MLLPLLRAQSPIPGQGIKISQVMGLSKKKKIKVTKKIDLKNPHHTQKNPHHKKKRFFFVILYGDTH